MIIKKVIKQTKIAKYFRPSNVYRAETTKNINTAAIPTKMPNIM
jgi:hypothetical protein